MAAILEMPQYVAYLKKTAYGFIKVSAKPHSFHSFAQYLCLAAILHFAPVLRV